MPHVAGPDHDTVRSGFNRVLCVGVWFICGLVIVSMFFGTGYNQFAALVPLALIASLAWEGLWSPRLDVDDDAITVRNVFRTATIPWNALVHVDTKFSLTLYTPGRKVEVWVAPAPGRSIGYRSSMTGRDSQRARPFSSGSQRPGDLVTTESGSAAFIVRTRWERLQKAGRVDAGIAEQTTVRIDWHWQTIALLTALLALSIPAILVA